MAVASKMFAEPKSATKSFSTAKPLLTGELLISERDPASVLLKPLKPLKPLRPFRVF